MMKTSRPLACFMVFAIAEYFRSSLINISQTKANNRSIEEEQLKWRDVDALCRYIKCELLHFHKAIALNETYRNKLKWTDINGKGSKKLGKNNTFYLKHIRSHQSVGAVFFSLPLIMFAHPDCWASAVNNVSSLQLNVVFFENEWIWWFMFCC